jgi:hypothetical protein
MDCEQSHDEVKGVSRYRSRDERATRGGHEIRTSPDSSSKLREKKKPYNIYVQIVETTIFNKVYIMDKWFNGISME